MLLNYIGLLAVGLTCGVGFRWGGLDEQFASIAFMIATVATKFFTESNYVSTETFVLIIDLVLLACLVILALRSDRFWPLWAAAFQLVGTTVHLASMVETGNFAWAYAVGLIFWSYPVLIALGVGTWLEGRHRRTAALA